MPDHKLMTIELTIEGLSPRQVHWIHEIALWLIVLFGGKGGGGGVGKAEK